MFRDYAVRVNTVGATLYPPPDSHPHPHVAVAGPLQVPKFYYDQFGSVSVRVCDWILTESGLVHVRVRACVYLGWFARRPFSHIPIHTCDCRFMTDDEGALKLQGRA